MELSIRTRSVEVSDALRDLISKRLQFALDVFSDRVTNVSVYLADINGPRGGVDKSCQVTVSVRGIGDILVSGTGPTASAALTGATRRLKYRVSEALRQSHHAENESIRRMPAVA